MKKKKDGTRDLWETLQKQDSKFYSSQETGHVVVI